MKKKLKELLEKKKSQRTALVEKAGKTEDIEELRRLNTRMDELNEEIRSMQEMIDAMPEDTPPIDERTQTVGAPVPGIVAASAATGTEQGGHEARAASDPHASVEYRTAFMAFAQTGRIAPELRADATSTTTDVSAAIPTTILNEVIRRIKSYGQLYSRVRKIAVRGGVQVPIASITPQATWIAEGTVSERKKLDMSTKVTFSYFGLEIKISQTILTDATTLDVFETTVTEVISEAMVRALDIAIAAGTGSGQPLGITKDQRVTNIVTMTPTEFASWSAWKKKVFAKMPLAYKGGAVFVMSAATFDGYIDGMVDTAGQPIGRVNYGIGDAAQQYFGGKEVVEVEDDVVPAYEDAATGDVVAIFGNLAQYAINSNLQLLMSRYFDNDKNEWVDKAILICDGKVLDANAFLLVKKGAAG